MRLLLLRLYFMERVYQWFWHSRRRGHERQQAQIGKDHEASHRLGPRDEQECQIEQECQPTHTARAHARCKLSQGVAVKPEASSQRRHACRYQPNRKQDACQLGGDERCEQIRERHGLRRREQQQES